MHVVVRDDGSLHIPQVDMAIDCGRYVNPEGVRKQMEGAAIYGNIRFAMHGQITTTQGAVDQSNFHDYTITRMDRCASRCARAHRRGFHASPPVAAWASPACRPTRPALVNAIYNATGKRIRRLPIGDQLESA